MSIKFSKINVIKVSIEIVQSIQVTTKESSGSAFHQMILL